jgi:hypothetical protein
MEEGQFTLAKYALFAAVPFISESTARIILGQVLSAGLLASESEKGKVRLALPTEVLDTYFPGLFPHMRASSG